MVRRGGSRVDGVPRTARGPKGESGSAVVAALAISLVLVVLVGSVTARSIGALTGASAAHDRLEARTVAEQVLTETMRLLDDRVVQSGSVALDPALAARSDARIDVEEEADGTLAVRVEVRVGVAVASASARLRPRSVADLALLTESRARDPMLRGRPRMSCTWPLGDPRRDALCEDMPLLSGPIGGPVHSNDPVHLDPASQPPRSVTSSAVGVPDRSHRPQVSLPRDVRAVLGGEPPTCRFRGPTLLRFDGPRVRVTSPRSVPRADEPAGPDAAIDCLGVDRAELDGVVVVDLPSRAVIEIVDDESDDCVLHPLGLGRTEDLERDWRCDAGDAFVWGRYHEARTVLAAGSIQVVWDLEPGDASGPRPLQSGDVLGLVAGDSVVLRRPLGLDPLTLQMAPVPFAGPGVPPFGAHPLDAPNPTVQPWEEPRIVAAIAALRGSLAPQNVRHGPAPSAATTVIGSVAGRFAPAMNPVGAIESDPSPVGRFHLELVHDPRFDRFPPPAMPHIDGGRLRIVELDVG